MECAFYYEPSPPAIGGQLSMAVTKASPERHLGPGGLVPLVVSVSNRRVACYYLSFGPEETTTLRFLKGKCRASLPQFHAWHLFR